MLLLIALYGCMHSPNDPHVNEHQREPQKKLQHNAHIHKTFQTTAPTQSQRHGQYDPNPINTNHLKNTTDARTLRKRDDLFIRHLTPTAGSSKFICPQRTPGDPWETVVHAYAYPKTPWNIKNIVPVENTIKIIILNSTL